MHYLWDKVGQLKGAVGRLEAILDESSGKPEVRPAAVRAAVTYNGRLYRASSLLHPMPKEDR
jgi:hypothetical protein